MQRISISTCVPLKVSNIYFKLEKIYCINLSSLLNCFAYTGAWLRVVVEKPFGKDVQSAQILADTLIEHLADEEILRVDHYLGKAGVSAITKFRSLNPTHDSVLNKHNVLCP